MNRVPNEPGYKAFPDLYMREPTLNLGDPGYVFQAEIVRHSQVIVQVILKAFEVNLCSPFVTYSWFLVSNFGGAHADCGFLSPDHSCADQLESQGNKPCVS